jgi:hypothetical protein
LGITPTQELLGGKAAKPTLSRPTGGQEKHRTIRTGGTKKVQKRSTEKKEQKKENNDQNKNIYEDITCNDIVCNIAIRTIIRFACRRRVYAGLSI